MESSPSAVVESRVRETTEQIVAKVADRLKQEEEIAYEDLVGLGDDRNIIGTGAFGEVRKIQWRKTPAAAKISKHDNLSDKEKMLFLREL